MIRSILLLVVMSTATCQLVIVAISFWRQSFHDLFCMVALIPITQAAVSVVSCMDLAFKGASLIANAVWTTITLLLALPVAIIRCAVLDAGLWRPPAHGGCTFYEGDVQHTRSKPLRNKFRSAGGDSRTWTSVDSATAVYDAQ